MPQQITRNFIQILVAPFDTSIAPSSDMTINVEISNSPIKEWNGTYNDIPAVYMADQGLYMFGAPVTADTSSEVLFDFSQYPFNIEGSYDSQYNKTNWMLYVPDPEYFELPTTKYDIKVTANGLKTVTVSDDFEEVLKKAGASLGLTKLTLAGSFNWSGVTDTSVAYATQAITGRLESNIPTDNTPYFVYRITSFDTQVSPRPEILLIDSDTTKYWCSIDDILNFKFQFEKDFLSIVGTGSMSVSRSGVPSMSLSYITPGRNQSANAKVFVSAFADKSKLIAYEG